MSDLAGNPEDRFSHVTAHLSSFLAEVNKAQGIKVLKDGKVVPVEKTEEPQGIVKFQ